MFNSFLALSIVQKAFTLARFGWPMTVGAWEMIQDGKITRDEVHTIADYVVDQALGSRNEVVLWTSKGQ